MFSVFQPAVNTGCARIRNDVLSSLGSSISYNEDYLQGRVSALKSLDKRSDLFLCPLPQAVTIMSFDWVPEDSASPERGRQRSEPCELREPASEEERKGENL